MPHVCKQPASDDISEKEIRGSKTQLHASYVLKFLAPKGMDTTLCCGKGLRVQIWCNTQRMQGAVPCSKGMDTTLHCGKGLRVQIWCNAQRMEGAVPGAGSQCEGNRRQA